jgi:L-iditol 2-dehydrogenase
MKAVAAVGGGRIEVVELPLPKLEPYEALVRVTACGFCATDVKIIDNGIGQLAVNYPVILGHEGVGEVVEVGPQARNLRVGDVFMNPHGRVPPATGYGKMWANMIEYAVVQDHAAMEALGVPRSARVGSGRKLPPDLAPADGACVLALTEALSGVRNFRVAPGQDVLVFGDGPIALALIHFARLAGARWIACVGHHDDRLARLGRLAKVDAAVNARTADAKAALGGRRFDLAIDAVGSVEVIRLASSLLKPGGTVGVYGVLKAKASTLSLIDLQNHTSLHMLNWPHGADGVHDELIEMFRDGRIRPSDYYSHLVPLAEAPRALELVRSREAFRVVLTMGGTPAAGTAA